MSRRQMASPLPTLAHDATGDPGIHLAALEQAIANAGVVVTRLADLGGAHGYSQPGRITILESLTPADAAAMLVHEFAHLCTRSGYVRFLLVTGRPRRQRL